MTAANRAEREAEDAKRRMWDFLRDYYAENEAAILEAQPWQWGVPINEIDWRATFTPIESAMWDAIRMEGVIFYPQYPQAGFFLDFANPQAKVAIECDGFQWHMDRVKDYERDSKLHRLGWRVYRVSGRHCMTETKFDDDNNELDVSHPAALLRELANLYPIGGRKTRGKEA
jgi:very-short-patch-repair endonuclease